MTPDSKISEEAVKAAFAWVELPNGYERLCASIDMKPFSAEDDLPGNAAAKILAAHARELSNWQYRAEQAEIRLAEIDDWNDAQPEHQVMPDEFYTKATAMLRNRREKFEIADLIADGLRKANAWRGIAERLGDCLYIQDHSHNSHCQYGDALGHEPCTCQFNDRQKERGEALSELAKLKGEQP